MSERPVWPDALHAKVVACELLGHDVVRRPHWRVCDECCFAAAMTFQATIAREDDHVIWAEKRPAGWTKIA